MASGWTKNWTDKHYDEWYQGLRLSERGVWDQLPGICKEQRDDGWIFLRNFRAAGQKLGCDGKTAEKILRKFHIDLKVRAEFSANGISIFMPTYLYNQQVRRVGDPPHSESRAEKSEKIPPYKIRVDKTRKDKSNPPNETNKIEEFKKAWEGLGFDKPETRLEYDPKQLVDFDTARQMMVNWLKANRAKKNYRKFITNWINREIVNATQGRTADAGIESEVELGIRLRREREAQA